MNNDANATRIRDAELLAYLDDAADAEVAAKIEGSEVYLKRAQELAKLTNRLTEKLYRHTCPDSLELGEYHLGMLADEQVQVIEAHLTECPHCSKELAELCEYLPEKFTETAWAINRGRNYLLLKKQFQQLGMQLESDAPLEGSLQPSHGLPYRGEISLAKVRNYLLNNKLLQKLGIQPRRDAPLEGSIQPSHGLPYGAECSCAVARGTPDDPGILVARLIYDADVVGADQVDKIPDSMVPKYGEIFIYEVDDIRIWINVKVDDEHPGMKILLGFIAGTNVGEWEVRLISGDEQVAITEIDDLGNFDFAGLSTAEYLIIFEGNGVRVYIPAIRV